MAGLLGDGEGILGMDPYALAQIYSLMTAQKGQNVGLTISTIAQQQERARAMKQEQQMNALKYQEAQRMQQQGDADRNAYSAAPDFSAPSAPNMAPTPENAKQLKAPTPYEQASKMVEYLRGKGVSQAYIKPYLDQMEKFRPKGKADQQLVKLPDGSLGLINIMDDGSSQIVPYSPAEKQREVNLGGTTQMMGEYTGRPGTAMANTMRPGEQQRLNLERERFNFDKEQGGKPQIITGQDGQVYSVNARGGTGQPVMGPDRQPLNVGSKQPNEQELTAAGYAGRMQKAEQILNQVGDAGIPTPSTFAAANIPYMTDPVKRRATERMVMSPAQRQFRQAQEDWVRAKLRKESGAVIADDEMQREIETYFPQIGEDAQTRSQKAASRAVAMEAMSTASGKAKDRISGVAGARPPLSSFNR